MITLGAADAVLQVRQDLTIRTPRTIDFSTGTYSFNDLTPGHAGLSLLDGDTVTLDADKLTSPTAAAARRLWRRGALACGSGDACDQRHRRSTSATERFAPMASAAVTTLAADDMDLRRGVGDVRCGRARSISLKRPSSAIARLRRRRRERTRSRACPSSTTAATVSDPGSAAAGGTSRRARRAPRFRSTARRWRSPEPRCAPRPERSTSSPRTGISVGDGAVLEHAGLRQELRRLRRSLSSCMRPAALCI